VLHKAGFSYIEEETKTLPWTWPGTAQEVWEQAQAVAMPFLPLLQRIPAEKREEIDREVIATIEQYADGSSIKFSAVVVLVSGTRANSQLSAALCD
jgi:hypothetical protein